MDTLAFVLLSIVTALVSVAVSAWWLYNRDQRRSRAQTAEWDEALRRLSVDGRLHINTPYNEQVRTLRRYDGLRSQQGDDFIADDVTYIRKIKQKRWDDRA